MKKFLQLTVIVLAVINFMAWGYALLFIGHNNWFWLGLIISAVLAWSNFWEMKGK